MNLTSQAEEQFLYLVQGTFLIQHVTEPTLGNSILDLVLTSEKDMIDQIHVGEMLTPSCGHNILRLITIIKIHVKVQDNDSGLPSRRL